MGTIFAEFDSSLVALALGLAMFAAWAFGGGTDGNRACSRISRYRLGDSNDPTDSVNHAMINSAQGLRWR
jgi:hypothetical protein